MGKRCTVDGCDQASVARGFCSHHYLQAKRAGTFTPRKQVGGGSTERFLRDHLNWSSDDCVIWPFGKHTKKGYGQANLSGWKVPAHRAMCILAHGEPPFPKAEAAHRCGIPACVNPNHLRWATPLENAADTVAMGNKPRGAAAITHSKLSESDVSAIRRDSRPVREIADQYKVTKTNIRFIRAGKTWAHVS